MWDRLITQQELAEKYDCDQGTVSLALSMAGVSRRQMPGKGRGRKYLYKEREAAEALRKLFVCRYEDYKRKAQVWQDKAHKVELIFEESEDDEA